MGIFTIRGDRLGYSNGIISLGVFSIILIIAFKGQTEHLIPLYAVGVFIPFTYNESLEVHIVNSRLFAF